MKTEEKATETQKAKKRTAKQSAYEGLDQKEIEQIQKDLVEA